MNLTLEQAARAKAAGRDLHPLANIASMPDAAQMKPWNMTVGIAVGLLVGILFWWSSYVPNKGMFQQLQLVLFPPVIAILIISARNRRKKMATMTPRLLLGTSVVGFGEGLLDTNPCSFAV